MAAIQQLARPPLMNAWPVCCVSALPQLGALRDVQARLNQYVREGPAGGGSREGSVGPRYGAPQDPTCTRSTDAGGTWDGAQDAALSMGPGCKTGTSLSGTGPGVDGVWRTGGDAGPNPNPSQQAPGPAPAAGVFAGASAGLTDIDARLHALQDFLRAAKAGVSTACG